MPTTSTLLDLPPISFVHVKVRLYYEQRHLMNGYREICMMQAFDYIQSD